MKKHEWLSLWSLNSKIQSDDSAWKTFSSCKALSNLSRNSIESLKNSCFQRCLFSIQWRHFEDNSSSNFILNFSFYDEIFHCTHSASRWCFCSFCCNWIDIDWLNFHWKHKHRNCHFSKVSWRSNSRIQCDNSVIWDRSSVLPLGVASRILQGKYILYVRESEQVSSSETHRFWHIVNPSKRGEGEMNREWTISIFQTKGLMR